MTKDVLIALTGQVLTAPLGAYMEPMPVSMRLPEDLDWKKLYLAASEQSVEQIVGYALQWEPAWNERGGEFDEAIEWAVALESTIFFETKSLLTEFERLGIVYCPLNGLVIKKFYPLPWMRTMKGIDLLIRREDISKADSAARGLGFIPNKSRDGEISLNSASGMYGLEIHTRTPAKGNAQAEDFWRSLSQADKNGCRYEMNDDELYEYILRRCARHLSKGGVNMRTLVDFALCRRALNMDGQEGGEAAKRAGLTKLNDTLVNVSSALLDMGTLDAKGAKLVDDVFALKKTESRNQSGVFGRFLGSFLKKKD